MDRPGGGIHTKGFGMVPNDTLVVLVEPHSERGHIPKLPTVQV